MKRRAHAKQRDLNEPEIVEALRRAGFSVLLDGPLDLLVGGRGRTWLLEVKRGELAPADRRLTPAEDSFIRDWRGGPAKIVRCPEEALCIVGVQGCRAWPPDPLDTCGCGEIEDPPWFAAARVAARRKT